MSKRISLSGAKRQLKDSRATYMYVCQCVYLYLFLASVHSYRMCKFEAGRELTILLQISKEIWNFMPTMRFHKTAACIYDANSAIFSVVPLHKPQHLQADCPHSVAHLTTLCDCGTGIAF